MVEKPIIFSTEMVKAILDGRKTQTRRVVKGRWIPLVEKVLEINGKWVFDVLGGELTTPYGQAGDRLWVRESYSTHPIHYKADGYELKDGEGTWHNKMFMPRWASRITLEITGVWVERVQEITDGMARAEGVGWVHQDIGLRPVYFKDYKTKFIELWDSLNAKRGYGWETNPWVWVISFKNLS